MSRFSPINYSALEDWWNAISQLAGWDPPGTGISAAEAAAVLSPHWQEGKARGLSDGPLFQFAVEGALDELAEMGIYDQGGDFTPPRQRREYGVEMSRFGRPSRRSPRISPAKRFAAQRGGGFFPGPYGGGGRQYGGKQGYGGQQYGGMQGYGGQQYGGMQGYGGQQYGTPRNYGGQQRYGGKQSYGGQQRYGDDELDIAMNTLKSKYHNLSRRGFVALDSMALKAYENGADDGLEGQDLVDYIVYKVEVGDINSEL